MIMVLIETHTELKRDIFLFHLLQNGYTLEEAEACTTLRGLEGANAGCDALVLSARRTRVIEHPAEACLLENMLLIIGHQEW